MTAFANSETVSNMITLNCELRSVNHRYYDVSIKLPERLKFAEDDIRNLLGKQIKRGKIECLISYKLQNNGTEDLLVNQAMLSRLLETTAKIEQQMHKPQSFTALDVLNFPGVQQEASTDNALLKQAITTLTEQAVQQIVTAREREGEQLGVLIKRRCLRMRDYVVEAQQRMPLVLELIVKRLRERVSAIINKPDNDRLEQEIVILTQKLDVDEELDRLDTHISEVLRVLNIDEPIGRRLDFLLQEMNRETNTLGAKSADIEMTRISIELKVLIEQMREQVQNIE